MLMLPLKSIVELQMGNNLKNQNEGGWLMWVMIRRLFDWGICCLRLNSFYRLLSFSLMILILFIPFSIHIRSGLQGVDSPLTRSSDSAIIKAIDTFNLSMFVESDNAFAAGGWIDNWVSQHTESGPSYFESQKRGYFTAGSFSARVPMTNDSLFTIQKPKLSGGCGGIDMFMGGFSFLNPEYLVKKLQNIMTAAPAVAFSVALNTISPEINQEVSKFSSMIDGLNHLQLNDCQAAKTITTVLTGKDMNGNDADRQAAMASFGASSGLTNLYNQFTSLTASSNGQSANGAQDYFQGCSADIQNLMSSSGFLLDKMATNYYAWLQPYVPLVRAYVGDVGIIIDATQGPTIYYYPPICGDQATDIDGFVNGSAKVMTTDMSGGFPSGVCEPAPDTNVNISTWVGNELSTIMNDMKTHTTLEAPEKMFVSNLPVPVYSALKLASGIDPYATGGLGGSMQGAISRMYAMRIMNDMLRLSNNMSAKIKMLIKANQHSAAGQAPPTCQLTLLAALPGAVDDLEKAGHDVMTDFTHSYQSSQQEMANNMKTAEFFQGAGQQMSKGLANLFGRGAADRAMQGLK